MTTPQPLRARAYRRDGWPGGHRFRRCAASWSGPECSAFLRLPCGFPPRGCVAASPLPGYRCRSWRAWLETSALTNDNSNYLQLFRGFSTSKGRMAGQFRLTNENKKGTIGRLSQGRRDMDPDKRNAWLRKLDEECPYQVVLPRRQLADDSAIMNFLMNYVGKFDMYVEDEYAAFVRYCFADPLDAAIFRSRFEPKVERLKLAG